LAQFLTRFDFKIIFCLGKQLGKADALSRRSYLALRPGDPDFDNQKQVLLGPTKLQATTIFATPLDSSLLDTIRQQLLSDEYAKEVFAHIGPHHASCSTLQESSQCYTDFKWQDNLLFYKNLLYVPARSPHL
jgi:hypothetical protein